MNLTETPEYISWPETHYVFVERTGPFMTNAPEAWGQAHRFLPLLVQTSRVTAYMSLYRPGPQIYRAGFGVDAAPSSVPDGMRYELFPGGRYARFVLTGPYTQLPQATGRVFEVVAEQGILVRDGFCIENYVNNPSVTPAEQLVTHIIVPTI